MSNLVEKIRDLAGQGLDRQAIANELSINISQLSRICRLAAIKLRRKQRISGPGLAERASALVETIRALSQDGLTAGQIAERASVSRQWVHQTAKKNGIPLPRAWRHQSTVAGTVAELLAGADLLARGWQIYLPAFRTGGHDLLATAGDKIISIEVRSAHRDHKGAIHFARRPNDKSSHYALVIKGEPIVYRPELEDL